MSMMGTNGFERKLVGQNLTENKPVYIASCTWAGDEKAALEKDVVLALYRVNGDDCAAPVGPLKSAAHARLAVKLAADNGAMLAGVYLHDHAPDALEVLNANI